MDPAFLLARVGGVPVRMHWSAPLLALLLAGTSVPGGLAWLAVVAVHEAGHALLAWRFGRGVLGVTLHALGGECEWLSGRRPWAAEIVAWGGVLAQAALLLAVLGLRRVVPLERAIGPDAMRVLTVYNAAMAALSLLPLRGLDGRHAWRLFGAIGAVKLSSSSPCARRSP